MASRRPSSATTVSTSAGTAEVTRRALAAGWFLTPNLLTKLEWVRQDYNGFAPTDIRNGARFSGVLLEGVIAF